MKWITGLCIIAMASLVGCATQPETVALDTQIPDELTDPVIPAPVQPAPPMDTVTNLPQSCFDRDQQIAKHFDVANQRLISASSALAVCNDNLKTLHRIHENSQVLVE